MKNYFLTALALGINIFIVFFLVYKNSLIVGLSFERQQHEKTKAFLLKEKERVQQQLCLAQSKSTIKHDAKNNLHMEKIKPHHIKSITQSI